jgi:adenosylmethionine-8-amino-7-oxononanoate aminotransferase
MSFDSNIKQFQSTDKLHVWHPFTQMKDWVREDNTPLIITEARDTFIKDIRGRWCLDGVSSLWVNLLGHRRAEIDEAIKRQLDKVAHSTLLGLANERSIELAGRLSLLLEKSFPGARLNKIFFSDNGSTSVEVALKMAFQYWQLRGVKEKKFFISLENGYHGDTLGAVSVGGVDIFHETFRPLLFKTFKAPSPYCYRCPLRKKKKTCGLACAGKIEGIFKKSADKVVGLILEPMVQAAGGIIVFPPGYLKRVREICSNYNVLLIADEVATGFGRTGKMFASEHEQVHPDILCLSKGITGGYMPLAATVATEEIYNAFLGEYAELKTFFHGHSYTGNPLACAAALAVLDIFEREDVLNSIKPKIEILKDWLTRMEYHPHVGQARGLGLMAGVELVKDKRKKTPYKWEERMGWKVALRCLEKGLFIRPLGNVLVIMPPLSISERNLERMLEIIEESIGEIT